MPVPHPTRGLANVVQHIARGADDTDLGLLDAGRDHGVEERDLGDLDAVVIPGGFSYGDYLRAGAIARFSPAMEAVAELAAAGGPRDLVACAIAAAGPVDGDFVKLTNNPWSIDRAEVSAALAGVPVAVVNDVEGVAAAWPHLAAGDAQRQGDVFERGHVLDQAEVLEHDADPAPQRRQLVQVARRHQPTTGEWVWLTWWGSSTTTRPEGSRSTRPP